MKNKFLPLMMLLYFACFGGARANVITIGDGTTYSTNLLKTDFKYFLTQQIYPAEAIGTAGTINSIAFYYHSTYDPYTSELTYDGFSLENIQVFMKNIDKDTFDNNLDMVPLGASDKVWEGPLSINGTGWVTIPLSTPFEYDGTSNLLVAFYDQNSDNPGYSINVYSTNSSVSSPAIAYYHFSYIPSLDDPSNWGGFKMTDNYRPNIQINITPIETLPYTYDFEAATPFNYWTVLTGTSDIQNSSSNSHNGTYYLRFRGSTSNIVVLPQFASPTNNLRLEFWTRPESYSSSYCGSFSVGYMTDLEDASSFVAIDSYSYGDWTSNTYVKKIVDFNVEGVPANAYIAMRHYDCSTVWYWYVDDVTVKVIPPCPEPTDVTVTETTMKGFTASFNSGDVSQGMWFYYWSETMVNPGSSNYGITYNTTFTVPTHAFLQPETTYYLWVGVYCEADDNFYWSDPTTFTTAQPCDPPTNIHLAQLYHNYAWLDWEPNGTDANFDMEYKLHSETNWTINPNYQNIGSGAGLMYLEPQTTYDVRVKRHCSNGYDTHWVETSFTTPCIPITSFPWNENFNSYNAGNFTEPCWINEHISGSGTQVFKIYTSSMGNNSTPKLQLPDMSIGTMTKLVLPFMDLPDSEYQFALDVYRNNSTYSPENNPYEGIRVFASTNGEIEGATELAFIPRQYNESSGDIPAEASTGWYTYDMPIGMSGYCYIILRGESRYCAATYMDNFVVEPIPPCHVPTHITVTNVTAHSFRVNYTPGSSAQDMWFFAWSTENVEPTTYIGWTMNPSTYSSYGLQPETHYYLWVGIECEEDVYFWANPVEFTTPEACPAPTGLHVVDVTAHGASFEWDAEPGAVFQQAYALNPAPGYIPEEPAWDYEYGNTCSWTNAFQEDSDYVFYLRKDCGSDGYSEIVSVPFHTPAACPIPTDVTFTGITQVQATANWVDYGETHISLNKAPFLFSDFETGDLNIWTSEGNASWTVGTGDHFVTTGAYSGNYNAKITHTTSGNETYLVSPMLNLDGITTARVNFWYINRQWVSDIDELGLYYRIDGGDWNELWSTTEAHETWTHETVTLTGLADNYQIGFKRTDNYGYGVGLDDIKIVFNDNEEEIYLSSYVVPYPDQSYTFTGLDPQTTYIVYLTAYCDGTPSPNWTNWNFFTTLPENVKVFVANGGWNVANNWSPAGAPTLDNDVIIRANAMVTDGVVACANKITFQGTPTPTLTINDGGQLVANCDVDATINKSITGYGIANENTDNGYYLIATPTLYNITAANAGLVTVGDNYDLYRWDRTADGEEWKNYKTSSFPLSSETGYLYANLNDMEISITGTLRNSNTTIVWDPPYDPDHFGWNLYGNPFPCNIHISGRLPYYKLEGNTFEMASGYDPIAPMEGFFVTSEMEHQHRGIERDVPGSGDKSTHLNIKLSQNTSTGSVALDNVLVVFEENEVEGVSKLVFNESNSRIALPHEGKDYGALFAKASGELPISFVAKTDGSYTLSFATEEVSLSYLHLIDNMTGTDVDLLSPQSAGDSGSESAMTAWGTGYTFTAKTTDPVNRFKVVFAQ